MLFPEVRRLPKVFVRKALASPVFIDGVGRVGKVIVDLVASSLERAEHIQGQPMIDSISFLHGMGLLEANASLDLLRKEVNNYLWQGYLGRHVNTNLFDYTSVLNSSKPEVYVKRLATRDTPENFLRIRAAIRRERPILLLHSHELLCNGGLFLRGFRNSRIVSVFRHPVDVAFSWQRRGFGERYGKDLRAGAHTVLGPGGPVPWWAFDWAEEYQELSPMERCMKSTTVLNKRYYDQLDQMPDGHRKRLLPLCFEHVVRDPKRMVSALATFLHTRPTAATWEVLKEQRVPRRLDRVEFLRRFKFVRRNSSKGAFEAFKKSCVLYERRFRPGISIRRLS